MKRDRRLAAALSLFVFSAVAGAWQAVITASWMRTAVMGGWESFVDTFGGELPYGPNEACFGSCAPDLPFLAGWLSIGSFLTGFVLVAWAWWKPRG